MLPDLWWELLLLCIRSSQVMGKRFSITIEWAENHLMSSLTDWVLFALCNSSTSIPPSSIVTGEHGCAHQRSGGKWNNVTIELSWDGEKVWTRPQCAMYISCCPWHIVVLASNRRHAVVTTVVVMCESVHTHPQLFENTMSCLGRHMEKSRYVWKEF